MKNLTNRIEDETLIALVEALIKYRQNLKSDTETIHIGIKTQAGSLIKFIDNEDDAENTIINIKKILHLDEFKLVS